MKAALLSKPSLGFSDYCILLLFALIVGYKTGNAATLATLALTGFSLGCASLSCLDCDEESSQVNLYRFLACAKFFIICGALFSTFVLAFEFGLFLTSPNVTH